MLSEVVERLREFNAVAMNEPAETPPEHRLRVFLHAFLQRIFEAHQADGWVHKIVQHELNRPTDAVNRILQEAIVPRMRYISAIVVELLGCAPNDARVMHCVGSVHGLCPVYSRMLLAPRLSVVAADLTLPGGRPDFDAAVEHVTQFSLAGIRAMRR